MEDTAIDWCLDMSKFKKIYTIGYSPFTTDDFISILHRENIDVIVDVRSIPFSSRFDSYNRENIQFKLRQENIGYLFFGKEFGARPEDKNLYTNNIADFNKMSNSIDFISGYNRVLNGLLRYNICFMCSEKDPIDCHRSILITNFIKNNIDDISITHILPDKFETQENLDKRVIDIYNKFSYSNSLFSRVKENVKIAAYKYIESKIAYKI